MTKITNISAGPRGVNTTSGVTYLDPGQTLDLDVSDDELKSLSEEWFAQGSLTKAEKAAAADAVDEASSTSAETRARRAAEAQAAAADEAKK
jgi:hypothetical protein